MFRISNDLQNISRFLLTILIIMFLIYLAIIQLPVLLFAAGLAYLFNPLLVLLARYKINRSYSLIIVLLVLLAVSGFVLIVFIPFTIQQLTGLLHSLPDILQSIKGAVNDLPKQFPEYIDLNQVNDLTFKLQTWLADSSSSSLAFLFALIPSLISLLVYLLLVPVLVFLFLKDSFEIKSWCCSLLPSTNKMLLSFFREIDLQLGSYIKGKLLEITIVTIVSWVVFWSLGLKYSFILALILGVSVLIPVVGAVIATIPVAVVAYWQWGLTDWFYIVMLSQGLLLILDGNALVPWLFADRLNLHPSVVILSVLYFGNVFGFWGVFFAIPLAGIINLLLNLWRNSKAVVGSGWLKE